MFDHIKLEIDESKYAKSPRIRVAAQKKQEAITVTDEMLRRREARVNKPFISRRPFFNYEATGDTIRHFVEGFGDDNPLYSNEEYAKKTKYGSIIAPPSFLYTNQWTSLAGGFPGIHGFYSGGDWQWFKPILKGTKLKSIIAVRDLETKHGRMTGGDNIYIDYGDIIYVNDETGEIVAKELFHVVLVERGASGSAKKEFNKGKPTYNKEEWLKILALYDKEEVRGSKPRYWEDVNIGDKIGPMIKGPLSVRDEVAWLMGAGTIFMRAHKNQFKYENGHPSTLEFVKETGDLDVPELVHILDHFSRAIGVERAYDYGSQRMTWFCNLFTNWMGDDGFLWKMSGDLRAFNQMGDTTLFEGKVVKKYVDDGKYCVDIEASAVNQRGEITMPPRISTVILPSRIGGSVIYPKPTQNLFEDVKKAKPLDEMIKEGLI